MSRFMQAWPGAQVRAVVPTHDNAYFAFENVSTARHYCIVFERAPGFWRLKERKA